MSEKATLPLEIVVNRYVAVVIRRHGGNLAAAARALGVSRQTLHNHRRRWRNRKKI